MLEIILGDSYLWQREQTYPRPGSTMRSYRVYFQDNSLANPDTFYS
jgi:hypothetical protein